VAVSANVAVHDVQPGAGVQLGVLEALGRVELAVRPRRLVEDLGERADDVVVVVERLVVVAACPAMPLHEDLVRRVNHNLPDIIICKERL
jgi:hypothetical protein